MKRSSLVLWGGWPAWFATLAVMTALIFPGPAQAQNSRGREYRPGPAAGAHPHGRQTAQSGASGGSGQIEQRLERVEDQLVEMQSMIGAVESLAKSGGSGGGAAGDLSAGGVRGVDAGGSGDLASRVQGLEMQLRAVSSQMNEILNRLSRLDGQGGAPRLGGERQGALSPSPGPGPSQQTGFGGTTIEPVEPGATDDGVAVGPAAGRRGADNGSYSGGGGEPAGGLRQRLSAASPSGAPEPAASSSPEARRLYDRAYNLLIARNFQGATDGFTQFLRLHPGDPLAGAAQYWLGQASFELGEYHKAADMFLKGYTNYPKSEKAPECLLKLGIALKRLNKKSAACDSFAEFGRRFPQAPQALLQRAEREKRRAGCAT